MSAWLKQLPFSGQLSAPYEKWLGEDVRYIVTPEEKKAFLQLSVQADMDAFVNQFWERRNPTPRTPLNPYKEEHYRQIGVLRCTFRRV